MAKKLLGSSASANFRTFERLGYFRRLITVMMNNLPNAGLSAINICDPRVHLADGAAAFNNSTHPNAVQCIDCGDQETWRIALNWWMTDHTAIKFNVTQSEISGDANDGATISGFGMRAQIDW